MEGKRGGRHCFGYENLSVWSFSHMTEIRSQWPYGLVFLPVSFLRSLTHICVVNAEEEEERKGKRVQDERLVLFPAEHQTREAWRWRLPGARLADWIKKWFLYNDARECSLKGDSKCALHMWRQHSLSVWLAAELQLQPDQQWLNNEKSSLNKIGSRDKWICLELGFWGITEHKNDFNAKISSY